MTWYPTQLLRPARLLYARRWTLIFSFSQSQLPLPPDRPRIPAVVTFTSLCTVKDGQPLAVTHESNEDSSHSQDHQSQIDCLCA